MILTCLLLAIPISLDCIGIGISYGIKKTKFTLIAKIIIFLIFLVMTFFAVKIGNAIVSIFSLKIANIIGVVLLVSIGIWFIIEALVNKNDEVKYISKVGAKEASILGFTISLDAFCAGIGYSSIGINAIFFPLFIAILHVLFIEIGELLGNKISKITKLSNNIWSVIAGVLLIIIAITKL